MDSGLGAFFIDLPHSQLLHRRTSRERGLSGPLASSAMGPEMATLSLFSATKSPVSGLQSRPFQATNTQRDRRRNRPERSSRRLSRRRSPRVYALKVAVSGNKCRQAFTVGHAGNVTDWWSADCMTAEMRMGERNSGLRSGPKICDPHAA